jgi:hypothetical protein
VTDWVSRGLLDHPEKRPLGHARGSLPALYTPQQRDLFLALLDKRRDGATHIKSLARIPIWLWLYYGDEWVPTRQVSRALKSWLGDYSVSRQAAARNATEMMKQFDHPDATLAARRRLHLALTEVARNRRIVDRAGLERAVRDVFEPATVFGAVRRGVGPSMMPVNADAVVPYIEARLASAHAISSSRVNEEFLNRARDEFRLSWAEYNRMRPHLSAQAGDQHAWMFDADTPESQLNDCANSFHTLLGFLLLTAKREARAASTAANRSR